MVKITFRKRVDYILESLNELAYFLDQYSKKSAGMDKKGDYYAAEKKAEEIVESAIAINQDILFSSFDHVSGSYKDSFKELSRLHVFSEKQISELANTASFRNRLAHDYIFANEAVTIKEMKNILKLFPGYLEVIRKWKK